MQDANDSSMAFEIPTDLIRQTQVSLRKEAGLASYDPNDPSIPNLPSLEEAISGFDPSPPYLRCKRCKGRLLRGLQSILGVYCGRPNEITPNPISYKSTFGYRWLLESLGLDGSERVGSPLETNEISRGKSTQIDEILLSDLLDLEIKWPAESENVETSISIREPSFKTTSSLNLEGVDLDNFFSDRKSDNIGTSERNLIPSNQVSSREIDAFSKPEIHSLFDNVSESEEKSSENEKGDSLSGWKAEFQTANSETLSEGSKTVDSFVGASVDISITMDTAFGRGNDLKDARFKDGSAQVISNFSGWIQDKSTSEFSNQAAEATFRGEHAGYNADNSNNPSSTSVTWIQDEQWQSNSPKKPENKIISEDDDSFDVWNDQWQSNNTKYPENIDKGDASFDAWTDFTSSTSLQGASNNLWDPAGDHIVHSSNQNLDVNLFSLDKNLQERQFDRFSQPDIFSGALSSQNSSTTLNGIQSESSVADRVVDNKVEVGGNSGQAANGDDVSNGATRSEKTDLEMLLSQMHDLSFMLESNLSVPQNQ